jgi:hypothetical protein
MSEEKEVATSSLDRISRPLLDTGHLEQTIDVFNYIRSKGFNMTKVSYLLFCHVHEPNVKAS